MQILFIEVNNFKTDDMHVDKWNRHTHNTNKLVLVLFSLEAVLGWGGVNQHLKYTSACLPIDHAS